MVLLAEIIQSRYSNKLVGLDTNLYLKQADFVTDMGVARKSWAPRFQQTRVLATRSQHGTRNKKKGFS